MAGGRERAASGGAATRSVSTMAEGATRPGWGAGGSLVPRECLDGSGELFLVFRKLVGLVLEVRLDTNEVDIYLMAYDVGIAEGVCGVGSAVSQGVRSGLKEVVRDSADAISFRVVKECRRLGRCHGALVRSSIGYRRSGGRSN